MFIHLSYYSRLEIYKEFTAMLDYLYNQSISNSMAVVASAKEMVLTLSLIKKMNPCQLN